MTTIHKTISIGIPAYNEAENIKDLLTLLVNQKTKRGTIFEIIVVSDGSTDDTVNIAKSVKDSRIQIIANNERRGLNPTQNEIVRRATGDILVLLNADVLPVGDLFVEDLVTPFFENSKIGLTGADTICARPLGWFEAVIVRGHQLRVHMYRAINKTNNLYLCHGRARAFSRALYSQIQWPEECPEDSYSYLFAISKGFQFAYVRSAEVIFRSPTTFRDYVKQNQRFARGKQLLSGHFSSAFVKKHFHIPAGSFGRTLVAYSPRKPFTTIAYGALFCIVRLFYRDYTSDDIRHDVSMTTKKINV